VTSDELLALLNEEAARLRVRPLTGRDVRAWVDRRLLKGAKPKGRRRGQNPIWIYSEESVRAALKIVELRAFRVTRTAALRVHLWVNGFDLATTEVHQALCSEYERCLSRRHREGHWREEDLDPTRLSSQARRRVERERARLDPRLARTGIPLPTEMLLDALRTAYWPPFEASRSGIEPVPLPLAGSVTRGLLASPDYSEESVKEHLGRVSEQDLLQARDSVRQFCALFSYGAAALGLEAISWVAHGDWLISNLAGTAVEIMRRRMQDNC
jgi:hypothetical protein